MKSLQESLLDDEDDLIKSTDKDLKNKRKQEIIKYIEDHYWIANIHGNQLKPSRAVKINTKDWTVDILNKKENIYTVSPEPKFGIEPTRELFPTGGLFKWGKINAMYKVWGCKMEECEGKPDSIHTVYLTRMHDINLSALPDDVFKLEIFDCDIETMQGCPKDIEVCQLTSCNKLKSLKGMPDEIYFLNIQYCRSIKDLIGIPKKIKKYLWLDRCSSLKSLKGLDKDSIRGAHFNYRNMPQLNITPEEIVELGPIVINNQEISQYKIKNNIK